MTPSIKDVLKAVEISFDVSVVELRSSRRSHGTASARHAACLIASRVTKQSLPAIGRYIGQRDHSTIIYGRERAKSLILRDAEYAEKVRYAERLCIHPARYHPATVKTCRTFQDFEAGAHVFRRLQNSNA